MTNMIEKAARAMWNTRTGSKSTPWEKLFDVHREAFIADVRAVLLAIRVPDDAMSERVAQAMWEARAVHFGEPALPMAHDERRDLFLSYARAAIPAAIDSILKEGT